VSACGLITHADSRGGQRADRPVRAYSLRVCLACLSLVRVSMLHDSSRAQTEVVRARFAEVSGGDLLLGPSSGSDEPLRMSAAVLRPVERTRRKRARICVRVHVHPRMAVCTCVIASVGEHGCTRREKVPRASKRERAGERVPPSRHCERTASRIRPCIGGRASSPRSPTVAIAHDGTKNG